MRTPGASAPAFAIPTACAIVGTWWLSGPPPATAWSQPPASEVVVAVITRRAGPAARLAHDHLIVARAPRIESAIDPDVPERSRFRVEVAVDSLVVDSAALRARFSDRLVELSQLSEPFGGIDEDARGKVRDAMRDEDQLDAARYPTITAWLVSVDSVITPGSAWQITAALAVREDTARFPMIVRRLTAPPRGAPSSAGSDRERPDATRAHFEASGHVRFRALGIEPYSAFFGAVRNADRFGVYLRLPEQLAP